LVAVARSRILARVKRARFVMASFDPQLKNVILPPDAKGSNVCGWASLLSWPKRRTTWMYKLPRGAALGDTCVIRLAREEKLTVCLDKPDKDASLGITLRAGSRHPVVSHVTPLGLAAGKVMVGDVFRSVTCVQPSTGDHHEHTFKSTGHDETARVLGLAVGTLTINLRRPKPNRELKVHKRTPKSLIAVHQATEVPASSIGGAGTAPVASATQQAQAAPAASAAQLATRAAPATSPVQQGRTPPAASSSPPSSDALYRLLMRELQTRDITPEDYDLLLRLDEEIPKKNILSVEAVETVLEAAQPGTDHECAICVCDLEEGEPATRLRCCGYVYHRCCIQQWLTMGKATCPMCSTQQCMTIAAP